MATVSFEKESLDEADDFFSDFDDSLEEALIPEAPMVPAAPIPDAPVETIASSSQSSRRLAAALPVSHSDDQPESPKEKYSDAIDGSAEPSLNATTAVVPVPLEASQSTDAPNVIDDNPQPVEPTEPPLPQQEPDLAQALLQSEQNENAQDQQADEPAVDESLFSDADEASSSRRPNGLGTSSIRRRGTGRRDRKGTDPSTARIQAEHRFNDGQKLLKSKRYQNAVMAFNDAARSDLPIDWRERCFSAIEQAQLGMKRARRRRRFLWFLLAVAIAVAATWQYTGEVHNKWLRYQIDQISLFGSRGTDSCL